MDVPSAGKENFKNLLTCIGGMEPVGEDFTDQSWKNLKVNYQGKPRLW